MSDERPRAIRSRGLLHAGAMPIGALAVRRLALSIATLIVVAGTPIAVGQQQQSTPVYADDSPQAQGALDRAKELAAAGNVAEAARVIQQLLDTDAERVIPDVADPRLFTCLRTKANAILLENPALFDRYRAVEEPRARDQVAVGQIDAVERARLLTRSGLAAAIAVAERHLESARFEAARLSLEQLERHPDRKDPELGAKCADAARRVARYLDRAEVRAWAERWTKEAGKSDPVGEAIVPPPRAALRSSSPVSTRSTDVSPALQVDALVKSPLQSVWISDQVKRDLGDVVQMRSEREGSSRIAGADEPWIYPTAFGDLVYITDGSTTTALDRYTLAPVWSATPRVPGEEPVPGPYDPSGEETIFHPGVGRMLEDSPTVVVGGGVAISCAGLAFQSQRDDVGRIQAFDAATGRQLWSVNVARLADGLENAGIRGTPVIDGDTLVVGVKKTGQARRLLGLYLVGIDLRDGTTRWSRLLGSAGVLPRGGSGRVSDSPAVGQGIVYRSDEMGVIAAVEAANGRPLWVRTLDPGEPRIRETAGAWSTCTPILDGNRLLTLSPDRSQLLVLDAATGKLIATREAKTIGDPIYLVRIGDRLACVGDTAAFVPLAQAESASPVESPSFADAKPTGRAVAAEDRLVVPTQEGLILIDPTGPTARPKIVELAHSGNVVINGEHLLVTDATRLHSYLVWDRAEKLVKARIDASPKDPRPALTYAELAYRAGKPDRLVPALDLAINAIAADAASPVALAARLSVFSLTSDILARGLRDPAAPRVAFGDDQSGLEYAPPVRDLAVLDAVLQRLTRCAESEQEQTRALLLTASLRQTQSAMDRAVAAYQEIIQTPALASSIYVAGNTQVRAELEATRLLKELVKSSGARVYATFDAEAARALAELGASPAPEALRDMVRRYPAAGQNAGILLSLGDQLAATSDHGGAAAAYELALQAATEGMSAGRDDQQAALGTIGGKLTAELVALDRPASALRVLKSLSTQYPKAQFALDAGVDATLRSLEQRVALGGRPAKLGTKVGPEVQTLEGWSLLQAISRERGPAPTEHVLMYAPGKKQLALWTIGGDAAGLSKAWSRDIGSIQPVLVRIDNASALLFWPTASGGELERVDLSDGKTLWRTESFDSMSPATPSNEDPRLKSIATPLDGQLKATDLLIALDDQVAVLAQRGGRAAGIDLATGKSLWANPATLERVFDMSVGFGHLMIIGETERQRDDGMGFDLIPAMRELDARTGQVMRQVDRPQGHFRWIRVVAEDMAIAGLADGVVAMDIKSWHERWAITGENARMSTDAWVVGQKVLVMDQRRDLWVAALGSGQIVRDDITTNSRVSDRGPVRAQGVGDSIVFTADRGMLVIGPAGELSGMDPLGALRDLITPVIAEKYAVTVDADLTRKDDQQSFDLMLIDTQSGKMVLQQAVAAYAPPRALAVLDGRAIVTCAGVTLVIPLK